MIRYLRNSEIDYEKWDECVKKCINYSIYTLSWYLDMVSSEWDALVEGEYESVFPLPFRRKYGISYIYQPPYTQQLGLFSRKPGSEEKSKNFLDAIPTTFRVVQYNLNSYNSPPMDMSGIGMKQNFELDLISSYEDISRSYSDNLKRNLRKAARAGVSLLEKSDPIPIIELFTNNQGEKYSYKSDPGMKTLSRLVFSCLHKGMAEVYSVYTASNQICAGAFFIRSGSKWIFLFSGSDDTGRQNAAMPFLIDSFIRNKSGRDATLDFEGSNDPGLARFYAGFGAKKLLYPYIDINNFGFPGNMIYRLYSMFR